MVELMSKIIRNAQAGCRGDGNLIEQNDIFVQLYYYYLIGGDFFMRPRLVRYYGPDYDNLKHGHVYQVHCLYSHGFMLIDDHHEHAYVYAGNCEVL